MYTGSLLLAVALALGACSKSDEVSQPSGTQDKPTQNEPTQNEPTQAEPTPVEPTNDDPDAARLSALADAANCDDPNSPMRPWCIAATGWADGDAAPLPDGDAVLPGLTIELEDGESVADALINKVSLSALSLHDDGTKRLATITMVKPENDDEAKMIGEVVVALALVFKGKQTAAKIPAELAGYLGTLPAQANHELTKSDRGWTWKGPSTAQLRKVGEHWVAIETPTQGARGIFVTIFTDKSE